MPFNPQKITPHRIGIALCICVLLGTSTVFLYNIGREPLQDYDEATYAEVVHEAFVNHDFLSYTYNHQTYFKKPPLLFWLIEFFEKLSFSVESAVRIPSALAGIVLVGVVMLFVYHVSKNWYGAALAGVMLATISPFMETARQARFDVLVSLFIVLASYCFYRGLKDPRWLLLFGLACGLAILSKSVIAVFAGVFVICISAYLRRFNWLKQKEFWGGIGVFLLVAVPWHLYETIKFGNAFWQSYIGTEVIARTQENLFWTVTITNADYIGYLAQFAEPWLVVFFVALIATRFVWKKMEHDERAVLFGVVGTMLSMILVFFNAATKAPTYLIPLYPFAALAVGIISSKLFSFERSRTATAVAAIIVTVVAIPYSIYNAYHINPYYSTELQLANEEKIVGQLLAQKEGANTLYIYQEENLGDIKFYSQNLNPLALLQQSSPLPGSFIVLDSTARTTFAKEFPRLHIQTIFAGTQVTLLQTK